MTPLPAPTPTGCSVQLLSLYLAHKIDVLVDYGDGHPPQRARLLGLLLPDETEDAEAVRVKFYDDGTRRWVDPKYVRPILRTFDDLLTPLADISQPLADKIIPAVEYVRSLWPREVNITAKPVANWLEIKSDRALLHYFWQKDLPESKLSLWGAEYLRSYQFAVGMMPEQFIPYYPRPAAA